MRHSLFAKMLSDKSVTDLSKLRYKYPQADIKEFAALLKVGFYRSVPLRDFKGEHLAYLEGVARISLLAIRVLMSPRDNSQRHGIEVMEDEIVSTLAIEQIGASRDSARRILAGHAPVNEAENCIYGMKRGLEFTAAPAHRINEENLHRLYELAVDAHLPREDCLLPGQV